MANLIELTRKSGMIVPDHVSEAMNAPPKEQPAPQPQATPQPQPGQTLEEWSHVPLAQ